MSRRQRYWLATTITVFCGLVTLWTLMLCGVSPKVSFACDIAVMIVMIIPAQRLVDIIEKRWRSA